MIHAKSAPLVEASPSPVPVLEQAPATGCAAPPKGQRFFHLDALRAALMFWGILVHASTVAKSGVFLGIATVSGLVRMEAFFVISGFLAYMLLKKYGARVTVRKRLLAIGVPLLAALILLNPVTNYLVYCFHNPPIPFAGFLSGEGIAGAKGPINWHLHLWFLIALLIYSMLAPLIERAVDFAVKLVGRGEEPVRSSSGVFLGIGAGMAIACIGSRIVFELIKPGLPGEMHYVVRSIGNFLPFYALGMLLFASPPLRGVFSKLHLIQTILSCALLAGINRAGGEDPGRMVEVLVLAVQTYVAVCLSSLLFWVAGKWVRAENPVARSLSEAAYSVYLFHFVVLYVSAFVFRPWIPDGFALLTVISAATFVFTFCLHRFVIRRVPVLELIFNGKPARRAK